MNISRKYSNLLLTLLTSKFVPYELVFNRRLVSPFEPPISTITMAKPHDYWELANQFKQVAIRAARTNILHAQKLSKQRYDKGRANPQYDVGDMVWVKVLTGRSKFDARFHGLFVITQRINEVKYGIRHMEMNYQREEHVNNFIPFYDRT